MMKSFKTNTGMLAIAIVFAALGSGGVIAQVTKVAGNASNAAGQTKRRRARGDRGGVGPKRRRSASASARVAFDLGQGATPAREKN